MRKFHLAILAILASVSIYGQSALSFTPCTTTFLNSTQDITADTNNVVYISYTVTSSMNSISKSTDNGNTFTHVALNTPLNFIALGTPGAVKLFNFSKMSIDGGVTWTFHSFFPTTTTSIYLFKVNNLTAYAYCMGTSGLTTFKTTDGGITWPSITSPPLYVNIGSDAYLFNQASVFYLGNNEIYYSYFYGTQNYLLNSKDFGATLTYTLNATTPALYKSAIVNFNNPSNFYLFYSNGGVQEFQFNYTSLTTNTTNVTYTVVGKPLYTANFGKSVVVNNTFIIIDNKSGTGSSNGILRMAIPTSTTTIGVNELNKGSVLNVYPNPCVNKLNISVNNNTNYIVSNQLGQCILSGITNDFINTETLVPGIYFLTLKNAPPIKFIKE